VSLGELLADSIQNFFNLDSQFFHSIRPFLFSPGKLTVAFIHGQRKRYIHPIRLYLIISLFFFFFFSWSVNFDDLDFLADDGEAELYVETDSTGNDTLAEKGSTINIGKIDLTLGHYQFNEVDSKLFSAWIKDSRMTPDALLDSLGASHKDAFTLYLSKQVLKLGQNQPETLVKEVIRNIPVMVFFLIPVFAFFLAAIYFRSKKLYIEHLIVSFHVHCYIFFWFSLLLVTTLLPFSWLKGHEVTTLWIVVFYIFFLLLRVYKQSWLKTGVKMFVLFAFYSVVVLTAAILEVVISLAFF
jgi:hypothetical protein